MRKIVIVNALGNLNSGRYHRNFGGFDFKTESKLHSSGRRTSRRVFFTEPTVCEILEKVKIDGEFYHELKIIVGTGNVFDKAHHNAYSNSTLKFYVHTDRINEPDFIKGDLATKIYEKVEAYKAQHPDFPMYLFKNQHGAYDSGRPSRVSVEKMIEIDGEEIAFDFNHNREYRFSELKESVDDKNRGSALALASKLGALSGLKPANTEDFLSQEDDDLQFDASYIDLYRDINGRVIIKQEDYQDFKQEFEALVNKYHKPLKPIDLEFSEYDKLHKVQLDTCEIQQHMLDIGENIDATLEQKKGFIAGVKYGL